MIKQCRKFLMTMNNPQDKGHSVDSCLKAVASLKGMKYACAALEIGAKEHTPHIHLFVVYENAKLWDTMRRLIPNADWECCRGTNQQNRDYVFKLVSLAILLNFQLGARVGELCTLKKSDIDVLNRKIRINRIERSYRPITMVKGQLVEEKTIHVVVEGRTKKDSNRYLDLSDEALLIINRALELQKELGINSEYIFADETGKNIIRQRINDCLRDYCKRISLDPKSSHKVRKTVLSTLFANGFDLDEVKQIAGHRSKSTTLKYYLFSMKQKEDRQERLSKALSSKHCTFSQSSVNQFITA